VPLDARLPVVERLDRREPAAVGLFTRRLDVVPSVAVACARESLVEDVEVDLLEVGRRCAALPVKDGRAADEVLGYDERGLPS